MSRCVECGSEMHPSDASQYEECYRCRKNTCHRVRDLTRNGTEERGRKALSTTIQDMLAEEVDEDDP